MRSLQVLSLPLYLERELIWTGTCLTLTSVLALSIYWLFLASCRNHDSCSVLPFYSCRYYTRTSTGNINCLPSPLCRDCWRSAFSYSGSWMAMLVLLCLRLKQRIPPLAGIYLVFLVYLALQPYALFHLGFQLSFLISFGLIVSATTIQARYSSYIGQLTAVTLIAQLLSAPIILLHTYEWSWFSIPLNLLYVPFIALFVLPSSLLSFFCFN